MAAAMKTVVCRPPQAHRICILFASQTGTAQITLAQDVAERIGREAGRRGFLPTVCALDMFPITKLPHEKLVIFVASTTGDGEAPDNMKTFWRFLLQRSLPNNALKQLRFSIFGLGDSGYAKFNATARKLQQRLLQLGASEFCPRGLGDDQSEPLGMDGDLEEWLKVLWPEALKLHPLPPGCVVDDSPELLACRYTVHPADPKSASGISVSAAQRPPSAGWQARKAFLPSLPVDAHVCVSGSKLCTGRLTTNTRMTASEWEQDVRHLEFECDHLPPSLAAGDIATFWPSAPSDLVSRLCLCLGLQPDTRIVISTREVQVASSTAAADVHSAPAADATPLALQSPPQGSAVPTSPITQLPGELTVHDLFKHFIDIAGVPRRSVFEQLSFFSKGNEEEAEKLREISGPAGADLYASYAKRERRNIVEILEDFKSIQVPVAFLLELLPPIAPRHFSIASSPALDSGKLHLCMAVVRYETPFKRSIRGLCSNWLANMSVGTELVFSVRPGLLRLPPAHRSLCTTVLAAGGSQAPPGNTAPLIFIGPGTGVAPMRGMLRELSAACTKLGHVPPSWDVRLYFGCRKSAADHLYANEWQQLQASGVLSSYRCAFSRESATKVYVQTLLWEDRQSIAQALQHPQSALFIAGNAKRMPTDVLAVLHKVVEAAGATPQQAKAHLAAMQRQKRLVIEAWS